MDATGSTRDRVSISLTGSEGLVLSHALDQWQSDGTISRLDDAAKRVLADLTAVLEPLNEDILSSDYGKALEQARAEVLCAP